MKRYILLIALATTYLVGSAHASAQLDDKLTAALKQRSANSDLYTVIVTMKDRHEERMLMLDTFENRDFTDRSHRLKTVGKMMQENAAASQNALLKELSDMPQIRSSGQQTVAVETESLWASNQMIVKNADVNLIRRLAQRNDVKRIEAEYSIKIIDETVTVKAAAMREGNQWGVENVNAPDVWRSGNRGQGIKVGVIDTGVLESHEALRDNYVGAQNYGWFDPSGASRTPTDVQGHGTHCTGSIVGRTRGVGVAPDAKWMACRGCGSSSCDSTHLARCGQFMACPTDPMGQNPRCDMAPHVVSNSWGGFSLGGGNTSYDEIIKAWHRLDIIPIFALGNSGPVCHSAGSPGDSPMVIGVGATDERNGVASFSSRGPTIIGQKVKPDVAAPGADIWSSSRKGTDKYEKMSGTSMACPHTAGVVALMLASRPERRLKYQTVFKALTDSAVRTRAGIISPNCLLGPTEDNGRKTNQDGYGRIIADQAIASIRV